MNGAERFKQLVAVSIPVITSARGGFSDFCIPLWGVLVQKFAGGPPCSPRTVLPGLLAPGVLPSGACVGRQGAVKGQ